MEIGPLLMEQEQEQVVFGAAWNKELQNKQKVILANNSYKGSRKKSSSTNGQAIKRGEG